MDIASTPPPSAAPKDTRRADPLFAKAQQLEAAFLSEMLAYSGLDAAEGSFSGGEGEAQFASFLRAEQARLMVERGGIGLAEQLFRALGGGAENVG